MMNKTRTGVVRRCAAGSLALVVAATVLVLSASPASAANPLTIDKTAGPSPVAQGQEIVYTIVVRNTGGAKVTEAVVTDVVNGVAGVDETNRLDLTSSVGSCGQDGNTVRCSAPTLEGFQSWTITIRGKVTASNGSTLHNTASVTGTKSATTFTTSDTVSVQVVSGAGQPLPDLVATIKAPTTTPPSNDMLYTVTVANIGSVKASDIALTVTLPPTVDFVAANATSLFACELPPGAVTLTCTGGAVNAGDVATVQVGVVSPSFDTTVTVTTAVDPLDTIPEANELNNASQATTQVGTVPPADTISLVKTDTPDPVTPGEVLTYNLKLTNTSAYRADYIEVVDGTQGLEAASVTATAIVTGSAVGMTCTVNAPKVSCTTTRFQPGAVADIVVKGTVIGPAGTTVLNTATVNGNIRNKGVTNTASTITTVRPAIDLTVTQHRTLPAPPAPVRAADRFDYTITVGNSGLYTATNVLVREPLPKGVFLDSFTSSDGDVTCTADAAQVVTCTLPQVLGVNASGLDQGATETVTLALIAPQTLPSSAPASAIGPITSTVTVDPNNTIPEAEESNNTATTTTDVTTGIDLTVFKADAPDPVARNGTLTYTITVENRGTQDATGVVVRDTLPTGSEFRSAFDTDTDPGAGVHLHDFTCSHSNGVVECVGGVINGTYSGIGPVPPEVRPVDVAVITIHVFAPDEPGLYSNEVRVDPDGRIPEIDETNNHVRETTTVENTHTGEGMYKELFIQNIVEAAPGGEDPPAYATSAVLNYDITVANAGQATAFNVVVDIKLPAGSTFRAANDTAGAGEGAFTCTHSSGVVRCTGGSVPGLGSRGIRVETFAPPTEGIALLEAIVDPANAIGEADEANNTADETTVVKAGEAPDVQGTYIDLEVKSVTDSPDPVATAGTLEYDVVIENHGSADAFDVAFRVTLPEGSVFRSAADANPTGAFVCSHAGNVVTCTGGRIGAIGGARTVKIGVFAPEQPGTYGVAVLVDPANAIAEGHEGNNSAQTTTTVQINGGGKFVDLTIAKTATPFKPTPTGGVEPGGGITYTITVSNAGTDDAFNVAVRDPLPAGMTFVSATPEAGSNFSCQQSGGVVDCIGGYVQGSTSGGSPPPARTITIKAKAPMEHGLEIVNQAFVDPANAIPEASEVNNTAQASSQVESIVDLKPTMTNGTAGTAAEGDWAFTAENLGTGEARNVLVVANFSAGTIHLNTVASGWTCEVFQNPVNQVRCTGDLVGTTSASFSVHYYKTADETINSYVQVDPQDAIVESDEFNNRADATG